MGDLNVSFSQQPQGATTTNFSVAPPGSFPATVDKKTDPAPGASSVSAIWGAISGNILAQIDLQQQFALKAGLAELNSHIANTSNPHGVTKAQVGLGNADNVSQATIVAAAVAAVAATYPVGVANGGTSATTASGARTNLGASPDGSTIFTSATAAGSAIATAASAGAQRSALGSGANGDALFTGATATANRATLGSGATGDALFVASSVQTVRDTLGLNVFSWRNRLRNAAFLVNQRGITAAQTASNAFLADGWQTGQNGTRMSYQLNTSGGPSIDVQNFLRATVTSTGSPAATEYQALVQNIEGTMFGDLGWGLSGTIGVVVTLWVRSSVAGTYSAAFRNAAANRSYIQSFTINSANTWEQKSFYVPNDTTGTWIKDSSGAGLTFFITMSCGSTFATTGGTWQAGNFIGLTGQTQITANAGATFDFSKAQIEAATVSTQPATPFERIPYDVELDRSQRYLPGWIIGGTTDDLSTVIFNTASAATATMIFKRPTRAAPTGIAFTPGASAANFSATTYSAVAALNAMTFNGGGTNSSRLSITQAGATWAASLCGWLLGNTVGAGFVLTGAEL